jgi:hypothetical protein
MSFYDKYFGQLVGATILSFKMAVDEDLEDVGFGTEYWPTFLVKLTNGEIIEIEISQDEEGNGPGMVLGLPTPE